MKRSRILLGVTTALLAVAGIAAAKAHRITKIPVYYSIQLTTGVYTCFQAPIVSKVVTNIQANGTGRAVTAILGSSYLLYTQLLPTVADPTKSHCGDPAFTTTRN